MTATRRLERTRARREEDADDPSASTAEARVVQFAVGAQRRNRSERTGDALGIKDSDCDRARKRFMQKRNRLVLKFYQLADEYPQSDALLYFGRPDWTTYAARKCVRY